MTIPQLAKRLPPEWREEFIQYVSTGKASAAFMQYLDQDLLCDECVDLAVDIVVKAVGEK